MSNVQCLGNESRLTDCPHSSGGSGSGATLECYPYNSGVCLHVYIYSYIIGSSNKSLNYVHDVPTIANTVWCQIF